MVFGLKKLQDELFCMTEERNYFQGKYLEQVSEIAALKEDLRKAKRQVSKLRGELMETSSTSLMLGDDASLHDSNAFQTPPKNNRRRSRRTSAAIEEYDEEKKDADSLLGGINPQPSEDDHSDEENHDEHDDEEEEKDGDEDTEAADIRQSAEKLLQWASYRSYQRSSSSANNSPDQGSLSSGPQVASPQEESLLGPMIPRTIESASLKNSMSNESEGSQTNDSSP